MANQTFVIFFIGLLILGCVASSRLSSRFSLPSLLVFLIIGLGANFFLSPRVNTVAEVGSILSWPVANGIGTIALAFILFAGGYDSNWKDFKSILVPGTILSTLGVLVTAAILGLGFFISFRQWIPVEQGAELFFQCLLLGAIISSTDASAVFSILRSKKIGLKGRLKPLLEYESGSNDPMATFLTLALLAIVLKYQQGETNVDLLKPVLFVLPAFLWKMIVGVVVGVVVGKLAVWLFNHINLEYDGLYYVMGLAVVLLAYSIADLIFANGFMAVYVAGVWMGNRKFVFHNSFGRFADALAWLMQVLLFTILGFKANLLALWHLKWLGLGAAAFLMFVARPISVFGLLWGKRFSAKAKLLVSWVGLRGGAPIMLATFPMLYAKDALQVPLGSSYIPLPEAMFNLVFFMVLLSVICQSFTIMPLAKLLKLDAPLNSVPTAPLSFEQVNFTKAKDGSLGYGDDFAENTTEEFLLQSGSDLEGKELKHLGLPVGVFVLMVRRGTRYIVPRGNTILKAGDYLTVLGTSDKLKETAVHLHSGDSLSS